MAGPVLKVIAQAARSRARLVAQGAVARGTVKVPGFGGCPLPGLHHAAGGRLGKAAPGRAASLAGQVALSVVGESGIELGAEGVARAVGYRGEEVIDLLLLADLLLD